MLTNTSAPFEPRPVAAPAPDRATLGRQGVVQLVLNLSPGGTERLAIELVTRLSGPFRMVVCCLDEAGEWASELTSLGIPVVSLNRAPGFHPSLGSRIARLAREHRADIIHCHHYSPFVYGRIAALLDPRLRLIFTEHGRLSDEPPTAKRRLANLVLSRLPGPLYAVSSALRDHLVASGFPSRLGVIYNGIDPGERPSESDRRRARRELELEDGDVVVGTAARLDSVKDLPTLVAAVVEARAHVPAIKLVVVGDGSERAALEALVRKHGVSGSVRLLGYRSDVRRLLPAFDIYANSSISEGVSLTILEAMAAELPVVATAVGGTPEVVVRDVTGLLVEPRQPTAMAASFVSLAGAPDRRRTLGLQGRARVEASFTIQRMVQEYAGQYEKLGRREGRTNG